MSLSLSRRTLVVGSFMLMLARSLQAADLATEGAPKPVYTEEKRDSVHVQNFEALHAGASSSIDQIRQILDLESRATSIDDAIRIKTSGLSYVTSLYEFDYLCTAPFSNPSDGYKEALGRFISSYLGSFLRSSQDLAMLGRFESRCTTIDQAIRVKELGLSVASSIYDFEIITQDPFPNSSEGYKTRRGAFVAQYAGNFARRGDPTDLLLVLEGRCTTIDDAMRVKEAGLNAMTSLEDFARLVQPAFSNPSSGYLERRIQFLVRSVGYAVTDSSNIETLLALESQVTTIDQAIAVKTAGLVAVHSLEQFLQLTRYAFPNPSQGYRDAVSRFIATYGGRYGA